MGFDRFASGSGSTGPRQRPSPDGQPGAERQAILRCSVSSGVPEASTLCQFTVPSGVASCCSATSRVASDASCSRRSIRESRVARSAVRNRPTKRSMVLTRQIWRCCPLGLPQEGGIKNNRTTLGKDPRCGLREQVVYALRGRGLIGSLRQGCGFPHGKQTLAHDIRRRRRA